jgi:hypothetical protein
MVIKRNAFRALCNSEGMDLMWDPMRRCYVIYDVQRPSTKAVQYAEEWIDSLSPDELDLLMTELKLKLLF